MISRLSPPNSVRPRDTPRSPKRPAHRRCRAARTWSLTRARRCPAPRHSRRAVARMCAPLLHFLGLGASRMPMRLDNSSARRPTSSGSESPPQPLRARGRPSRALPLDFPRAPRTRLSKCTARCCSAGACASPARSSPLAAIASMSNGVARVTTSARSHQSRRAPGARSRHATSRLSRSGSPACSPVQRATNAALISS